MGFEKFVRDRVLDPLTRVVQSGVSATDLARAFSVGLIGGLWPIPGITTVIVFLMCGLLQTNFIVAQVINLIVTPVDIVLAPLFISAGCALFRIDAGVMVAPTELFTMLKNDPMKTLSTVGLAILAGIAAWTIFGLLTFKPLSLAIKPAMAIVAGKLKRRETPRSSSRNSLP